VHKEQSLQELEASNGVVAGVGGLHTLSAHDADTDVRRQDHVHVVRTVTCNEATTAHCDATAACITASSAEDTHQ
jgi:hypothetical protein